MANHKSSEKRARQTERRNKVNRARRQHIQTLVSAVEAAIASNDLEGARKAQVKAEAALARGAGRGTLHRKTASRRTSRITKRVKALKKA